MKITEEEKVAIKISDLLSDIRLDIDEIGASFTDLASIAMFLRLEQLYNSAKRRADIE
jgi:hypothetical protein